MELEEPAQTAILRNEADFAGRFRHARKFIPLRLFLWMRRIFLLLFVVTLPHPWQETALAQGRQQVSLKTGFTLEVDRVEPDGESLVLHSGEGRIFVARSDVERVEDLPWVMPPAAALPEAETPPSVADLVRRSSAQHGLPEAFVRSVAEAESALQPQAVSPKGARGVMQLMPATAAALGVNPDEPAENIDGGAKLLRELLLRYQNQPDQVRLALAAYNAGAGAVAKYGGVPPYRETSAYVERVLRRYRARVASPRMEQDAGGGIRR